MTPTYSRSQSEVKGDLHKLNFEIELSNKFQDLNQETVRTSTQNNTKESEKQHPSTTTIPHNLPPPVMLKINENYTEQMKTITDRLPAVRGKLSGEYLKLNTNTLDQQSELIALLEGLDYEFYVIKSKSERPIKVVSLIKGLPRDTDTSTIHHELIMLGYTVDKETHLRPKHSIDINNYKCYRNDRPTEGPASEKFAKINYPIALERKIATFTEAVCSAHFESSQPLTDTRHTFTPHIKELITLNNRARELWFQQDGTTCHTAHATIDLLTDTFGDRLISRFGPVNWPLRSCDLTPLDYFLWGYVKSLVYADKPQTLDHLEENIRRVIADIRPQILEKVIENWTSRLDHIRASRGSPMPEIIFKITPFRTESNRLHARIKKELKKHSQDTWKNRLLALNTQDNSFWNIQKIFKNKRVDIPALHTASGVAITDDQNANLIANTLKDNFTENTRPANFSNSIDSDVTSTLERFFSHPPLTLISPTNPDEVSTYNNKLYIKIMKTLQVKTISLTK
ncbi:putative DD41D transposase [Trichonephila clavipes]|nr:putative DD41D transposase [Trichonephila clavipes]